MELISPAEFELYDILSDPLNGDQGVSLILKHRNSGEIVEYFSAYGYEHTYGGKVYIPIYD